MTRFSLSFPSTEAAFRISDDIFGFIIDTIDADLAERQRVKLIVSELFMNAYLHGNRMDPSKYIDVAMEMRADEFAVVVKDEGIGLTEKRFKDMVESSANLESSTGRGIRIVHRLSDKIGLFKDENGKFCIKAIRKLNSRPISTKDR